MTRSFRLIAALCLALTATGCAAPASQQNMEVHKSTLSVLPNPALSGKMEVRSVTGGEETSPLWKSRVDNQNFKGALQHSLENLGYAAADGKTPKYFIDANLQSIDQPTVGFSFDITSTVIYTVEGAGKSKAYPVTATGTASTSDKLLGVERLKLANERSIQENIKAFLIRISEETKK